MHRYIHGARIHEHCAGRKAQNRQGGPLAFAECDSGDSCRVHDAADHGEYAKGDTDRRSGLENPGTLSGRTSESPIEDYDDE